jgi:cytochrome c biogenesis protein CcmG/thiol:disulfide interchange protein DsbE
MKHKNNKIKIFITLFAALFSLSVWGCTDEGDFEQKAPNFRLTALSGQTATLKEHRGRVVLLDFWATWCPPCRMSIPELIRMQDKYRDEGLIIIGISIDDPNVASDSYLKAFKEKFGLNYIILRSNLGIMENYFGRPRAAIPTAFVIDRKGIIKAKIVGFRPEALEMAVKETLS